MNISPQIVVASFSDTPKDHSMTAKQIHAELTARRLTVKKALQATRMKIARAVSSGHLKQVSMSATDELLYQPTPKGRDALNRLREQLGDL